MKVLITGNEGFIGNYLEKFYAAHSHVVYGWNRLGITVNGKLMTQFNMGSSNDTCRAIAEILPDLIIHCAGNAEVSRSVTDHLSDLQDNYVTTENLLFALKDNRLTDCKFILLSSAAVYGNPVMLPTDELQPLNPLSPYALHKKAAEDVCIFMKKNYSLDVKIARIFSVYGPGLKKQIFWDMYHKIKQSGRLDMLGNGEESRDYIFIDDVVKAISLIAKDRSSALIFNVANGKEIKIKEVAEIFAREVGISKEKISFTGTRREGDPVNWRADIGRMINLGYEQNIPFEVGVRRYIKWVSETCKEIS